MRPELIEALKIPLQSNGTRSESYKKRKMNINWIEGLDRKSLSFGAEERKVLMYKTSIGETLFLQYPGKESSPVTRTGRPRLKTAIRPWDFRPKIFLANGRPGEDLSFFQIWESILKNSSTLVEKKDTDTLRLLAILFYRMAYMIDHYPNDKLVYSYTDEVDNSKYILSEKRYQSSYNTYIPPRIALNACASLNWCGMSLEGFLVYNDLLAWNEDCKYYYRNEFVKKNDAWINAVGRINNLLTHIRFIGCCLNMVSLAEVFQDFSRSQGVAPASTDEIKKICSDFISE